MSDNDETLTHDNEEKSCGLCNEEDNDEMVSCDDCKSWFHFNCVNVDSTIEEKDWSCDKCTKQRETMLNESNKRDSQEKQPNVSSDEIIIENLKEKLNAQLQEANIQKLKMDELMKQMEGIKQQLLLTNINRSNKFEPKSDVENQTNSEKPLMEVQNFLARQTIKTDLPIFSGNYEEWPCFYASFVHTNNACKFSDIENLFRLQKALKGEARKMVESRLSNPANVQKIIDSLKLRYGQPDALIQDQINKIFKTNPPDDRKIESYAYYANNIENLICAIEAADVSRYTIHDGRLLRDLSARLPPSKRLEWGRHCNEIGGEVTLRNFADWLNEIARAVYKVMPILPSPSHNSTARLNIHNDSNHQFEKRCHVCHKNCKSTNDCEKFKRMTTTERWSIVKKCNLCRICLNRHRSPQCRAAKECGINNCKRLHHQLLHNIQADITTEPVESTLNATQYKQKPGILYRIVPITLTSPTATVNTYAFIDDGSSTTLIDECIADILNSKGEGKELCLQWTDGSTRIEKDSKEVELKISGQYKNAKSYQIKARTVSNLMLPTQTVDMKDLGEKYKHLKNIDAKSYFEAKPRILVGLNYWHLCIPRNSHDIREGGIAEPIATRTKLGWDICGPTCGRSETNGTQSMNYHVCECQPNDESLEEAVKQFYNIDAMGISNKRAYILTDEEKRAERIMSETTKFENGQYVVSLLWKYDKIQLPDSKHMAFKRLQCLEKKLMSHPQHLKEFRNQITDYTNKGFIRLLSKIEVDQVSPVTWYLPMFFATNPNKPNKIRLVWDAAAAVNGISLNTMLLKGPDLMCSLIAILFRFRQYKVAFTGDIRQMFHMIKVDQKDQQAQRFLWRDCKSNTTPEVYCMNVMTFGATCSPYQAQYVMRLNASKYMDEFPEAVKSILSNTYMDDLLDGCNDTKQAIEKAKQIKSIHANGNFEIRNWISNSREFCAAMNEKYTQELQPLMDGTQDIEKVLGIFWNINGDAITYSLKYNKASFDVLSGQRCPSKRDILRTLMSIYDPPGLISNFVVGLKIILRETWRIKLSWDDQIPEELYENWKKWLNQLHLIETVNIPRCYISEDTSWEDCEVTLHTISDAGEPAYACAVYLRIETPIKTIVTLVAAKAKASPLKYTSTPRLELQAALLGTRLANTVSSSLTIPIQSKYYWTDSIAVLSWLYSSKKLSTWIAFRVGEIKEATNLNNWKWIPSKENSADLATKWNNNIDLDLKGKWFSGPEFLKDKPDHWPVRSKETDSVNIDENLSDEYVAVHTQTELIFNPNLFSSFRSLVKAAAYVYHYLHNLLQTVKKEKLSPVLTKEEWTQGLQKILLEAQSIAFGKEITSLKTGSPIDSRSPLYRLSPFLDENNLIRLRTRIEAAAHISFDTKYPIVLPKNSRIAELIVVDTHQRFAHQFNETVVNHIRMKYHIPQLRNLVKKVQRECQKCKNDRAKPVIPEMAPLPPARLAHNMPAFTFTGVDLFGPIMVKVRRCLEKRWGVIFTCLTIRAVHIELVSSLSSDSFLLAFRNFTNRRGRPQEIYSDRGTNFLGAKKELHIAREEMLKIQNATECPEIKWNFNPPHAPHMGGAWERLIRSVKSALKVIISPHQNPSPDILQAALIEVENIINSRPLTYVPLDNESAEAITPNHLLLGERSSVLASYPTDEVKIVKKQWQLSQIMAQRFWRRWIREYLPTLSQRQKWLKNGRRIREGDIVVIIDENDPTRRFPKGKILEVKKSSDGNIRKAVVQTESAILERPVAKLAVLDVIKESGHGVPTGGNVEKTA